MARTKCPLIRGETGIEGEYAICECETAACVAFEPTNRPNGELGYCKHFHSFITCW